MDDTAAGMDDDIDSITSVVLAEDSEDDAPPSDTPIMRAVKAVAATAANTCGNCQAVGRCVCATTWSHAALRAEEELRLPIKCTASVWYNDDGQTTRAASVTRGTVKRCLHDGTAKILFEPFDARGSDEDVVHPYISLLMSVPQDSWAWGEHRTRPSLRAREIARTEAMYADVLHECGVSMISTPTRSHTPCYEDTPESPTPSDDRVVRGNAGQLAWPLAFHRCISALVSLHRLMKLAKWLPHYRQYPYDSPLAKEMLLDKLCELGLTALVDAAVLLLKRVPSKHWDGGSGWPAVGDWSARLQDAHSPKTLLLCIDMATNKCVRWPETACSAHVQDEWPHHPPLVMRSGCFVCGHCATTSHPSLCGRRLCRQCLERYHSAEWIEDNELLDLTCGGCGRMGCAPHGCRTCGASLCERCVFVIHGEGMLQAVRRHRFHPEACTGCGQEEDRDATYHVGKRVVCDACRLEWHPRCHKPPLIDLPEESARWLCADCVISGEPQTPAWTLRTCALCAAPKESAVRAVSRLWMRNVRLVLSGMAAKTEKIDRFDHVTALRRLNKNVAATNSALRRCSHVLNDSAIALLARHAAKQGGMTVVSYCDGKATALGFLLRAGVRVRRYLSVECDTNCNRVARNLYGSQWGELLDASALRFYSEARELSISKLQALDCHPVHLVLSSTPCTDLSACKDTSRSAERSGLEGEQSKLFIEFAREFYPTLRAANGNVPLAVLAENVVPHRREDEAKMADLMGLPPLRSEAAVFEGARRLRLLFSNMLHVPVPNDTPNVTLQSVLNPGAVAIGQKAGCILTTGQRGHNEHVSTAKSSSERNRGRTFVLCAAHSTDVRGLQVPELARALGQPYFEVDSAAGGEGEKIALLGRSLARGQIVHALRRLIDTCLKAQIARDRQPGCDTEVPRPNHAPPPFEV